MDIWRAPHGVIGHIEPLSLSLPLSLFSITSRTDWSPPELWVWSKKKCRAVVICPDTGCVSSSSRHKGKQSHTNRRHCLLFAAHSSVCVCVCVRVCVCACERVDLAVCASVGRKYFSQPPPRILSGADTLHDIKPVIHPDRRPASERKRSDALVFIPLLLPPSVLTSNPPSTWTSVISSVRSDWSRPRLPPRCAHLCLSSVRKLSQTRAATCERDFAAVTCPGWSARVQLVRLTRPAWRGITCRSFAVVMLQMEMVIFLCLVLLMCVFSQEPSSKVVADRYAVFWNRTNAK